MLTNFRDKRLGNFGKGRSWMYNLCRGHNFLLFTVITVRGSFWKYSNSIKFVKEIVQVPFKINSPKLCPLWNSHLNFFSKNIWLLTSRVQPPFIACDAFIVCEILFILVNDWDWTFLIFEGFLLDGMGERVLVDDDLKISVLQLLLWLPAPCN